MIEGVPALSLLLIGCFAAVPFPTLLPSQRAIDSEYKTVHHNLSPLKKYHFDITIPKDWETLDVAIVDEPQGMEPREVAAFRQPGAWQSDSTVAAGAEVSVTVLRSSGAIKNGDTALQWLRTILDGTSAGYTILEHRTIVAQGIESADVLIRYGGEEPVIARFRVLPTADRRVFVITASAPLAEYQRVATELLTAIATFEIK